MARKIALKRKISVDKLSELALKDKTIDREIDSIHNKIQGSFVLDSRIAFKFFPDSFKIFLYCKPEIAAKRILKDKRAAESYSLQDTKKEIERRERLDILRYKKYYDINIIDFKNYDLVIDSSNMSEEKVNNAVLNALRSIYL